MKAKLKWKNIIGWTIAALVAGFIVYTNMQEQKALQNSGKRTVYALLPLTGYGSHVGAQQKAAIELWKEKNPNPSFNLHIVDSETAPMKAITALRQALLDEENPIVITSNALVSYSALPVIEEKNGFALWVCTFEREGFKNPHFLRISDRGMDSMPHVAKYLENHENIVVFYTNEDFGRNSVNIFKHMREQQGLSITKEIDIDPTQRDVRIEALKALDQKPSAIVVLGFSSLSVINLVKELRAQQYAGDIVMGVSIADPSVQRQLGNALEGIVFPDKKMQLSEGPNVEYLKKIEQAINGRPYYIPLEIWDTLDLIEWTIKNNKPFTQETYAKLGKWKGIAGDIEFLNDGNVIYEFYLATFKDGKIVPVEN